jgi:hypothetical protein
MFQAAQRIGKVIEKEYGATSLTIACQVSIPSFREVACVSLEGVAVILC